MISCFIMCQALHFVCRVTNTDINVGAVNQKHTSLPVCRSFVEKGGIVTDLCLVSYEVQHCRQKLDADWSIAVSTNPFSSSWQHLNNNDCLEVRKKDSQNSCTPYCVQQLC